MGKERSRAPALNRGMRILEILADARTPRTLSQIARELSISTSSIQRVVGELLAEGYISRTPTNGYYLTDRLYHLAQEGPRAQTLAYYALEPMREYVAETTESVHVSIGTADRFVVVGQVDSTDLVRIAIRQGSYPLTQHPSGQVLLAFEAPQCWLSATEMAGIALDLEGVRRQGWAFGASLRRQGVYHLAVPIVTERGSTYGALATSFALPLGEVTAEGYRDQLLPALSRAAERIGLKNPEAD